MKRSEEAKREGQPPDDRAKDMDLGSSGSTRMVVVVGGGGGGNHHHHRRLRHNQHQHQSHHEAGDPSRVGTNSPNPSSVPVDSQDSIVDNDASVTSGVDPPELLPAHEIASEIAATEPVDEEDDSDLTNNHQSSDNSHSRLDPDQDEDLDHNNLEEEATTVMIDTSDFRGLSSEPTYQTLNGRMTPPGFPTSSSYATLTPLQPLPPISTMSEKFSHYGHHHPGNGGFTLMQNPSSLGMGNNYHHHHHHQSSYDKLGSAMAAAGMNMSVSLGSGNIVIGSANHASVVQQQQHAAAAAMMNQQQHPNSNGHNSHSQSNHGGMSSPPYGHSNGLSSPDKSLSPTNGYDYSSGGQRVVLESPTQSPSSVNLHSPTSLMPALNGMSPSTPPSAQGMPPSPPDHKPNIGLIVSPHNQQHSPHVTYVTSSGQEVKVATSLAAVPATCNSPSNGSDTNPCCHCPFRLRSNRNHSSSCIFCRQQW